ncbi:MAG TPA: diaminopimelate decarboxylase [Opitutales bacterium]|nr:diaminopimelate decarboxylase [Opitutales bacterium]
MPSSPSSPGFESLRFLTPAQANEVRTRFGSPVYVYDQATLRRQADACLAFPNAFGLTVRFAMKACPNAAILQFFDSLGLHFDASSNWEAVRAMRAGIAPHKISLATQEMPENLADLHRRGVLFTACSLSQLDRFGRQFPGQKIALRLNPGLGSGHSGKTNVGGPGSSFGIWHELLEEAHDLITNHRLHVTKVHTHIGSGTDPEVWQKVAKMTLKFVKEFPEAETVNLGGGFKVARMAGEKTTDLQKIGAPVKALFEQMARETGRNLRLEIEPGTFLVATAGALVSAVQDIVTTGKKGHDFLKLDTGMTEILRPSLYGSQHAIVIVPAAGRAGKNGGKKEYLVVGHCCESGDLLTPAPGESETLAPRLLARAEIGDTCVIEGTGAYCAAMSAKNYNSFPEAPEILLREDGALRIIRRRQSLEQIVQNEG